MFSEFCVAGGPATPGVGLGRMWGSRVPLNTFKSCLMLVSCVLHQWLFDWVVAWVGLWGQTACVCVAPCGG